MIFFRWHFKIPTTLRRLSSSLSHLSSDLSYTRRFFKQKSVYFSSAYLNIEKQYCGTTANQLKRLSTVPMADSKTNELDSTPVPVPQKDGSTVSKKAQKRLARAQKYKEIKKQRKEKTKLAHKDDVGYSVGDLEESSYYFENGLRKVYPYNFIFSTYAKGRWVGRTIDDVLQNEFGYDHEDDLQRSFDADQIHVNDKPVGPGYKLKDCDRLSHRTHRHENPVAWTPIEIIKDTDDLVVINKPSSIPCHPCGRYRFNSVVFILGKEMGYTNLRNIYRLDRLTSGVLILAKTMEMTKILEDQVVNRQVQKEYVCRVVGEFPEGPVVVDQPLRPLSNKLRLQIVCSKGKASQTEFTRISYNGTSSVVRCRPFTGRTHQIRVHLQYLGYPIINDAFYNNPAWGPTGGKGADYQVPFEKVCETILEEHHANLWDGGENPLYFEKLKELEKSQESSVDRTLSTTKLETDDDSTTSVKDPSVGLTQEAVSAISNYSHTLDSSGDSEHSSIRADSENILSSQEPIKQCCVNGAEIDKDGVLDKKAASQGEVTDGRPGFDKSLWSISLLCELCKKLPIDAREKDLVMFLHALKYKGPDWEYETHLPEWAADDWDREKDYML